MAVGRSVIQRTGISRRTGSDCVEHAKRCAPALHRHALLLAGGFAFLKQEWEFVSRRPRVSLSGAPRRWLLGSGLDILFTIIQLASDSVRNLGMERLYMDREFKKAIEAGERTRATMELVRNWCSHARIEKFGGTGMIEEMTGLPIGNHGLKCDHTTAEGMYTWDLRESALDFYDRNCVDCKKRKPVGVPNLSSLVKERDDLRAVDARKASAAEANRVEERAIRQLARSHLRQGIGALSNTIIDHIDEFDEWTISFTYGDLFPTMRFQDGKPYRGQIYTKDEICKLIEEYGLPQEWNRRGNKGPERYIEVQIWDDKPLVKHILR